MRAPALRGWRSAANVEAKKPGEEGRGVFMRLDYSSLKIKML
jgi:hypothetical protein